jgi:hypothetical protein
MNMPGSLIYVGEVVHKRLRPRHHSLSYGVFSFLLDVDRIDELAASTRLFSHNHFNLVSFHDRDHGAGDGKPVGTHVREVLASAGIATGGGKVLLLCYPRVLGYVFNPLSVYYAYDAGGALTALVYEVNNTFGERTSYVVPAGTGTDGVYAQACNKVMFVSPFASGRGRYGFRVTAPGDDLLLAVLFRDADGPLIKTHFKGAAVSFTDGRIARLALRFPLMTLKVMAGIHLEALKLWLKGVPLVKGHTSPRYAVAIDTPNRKASQHA